MYIDPEYANYYAHAKLRTLGLTTMHYRDCIKRIRRDANLPSFSKMKTADDDWHNRVASVLLPVFETPILKSHIPAVKTLPIIPLGDHRWTSMLDGAVYFPDTDGMPIPSDLGLRLVDSKASSNSTRKKLFAELGVVDVSAEKIRKLILEKHKKHWDKITLKSSVDHLHYLYWTRKNFPDPRLRVSARFCLFNEQNVSVDGDHDVYFQAEEKYGIQEFLRPALEEHLGSDAFGSFINNKYFILAPGIKEKYVTFFFEHWLKFYVQILRAPRLNDPKDPFKLSNICSYIIEKDPKNLLGTLRAHWSEYQYHINYELIKKLSEVVIPCTNIGQRELRRTFLPLKELEICCSEFLEPQLFPFLVLDGASTVEEWKFLEMFGVGAKNGVHFCLEILRRFKENRLSFSYKIYEEIQRKVWASTDSNSDIQCVQYAKLDLLFDLVLDLKLT
jgi:hypothetical protein